jgi:hypothetical protein
MEEQLLGIDLIVVPHLVAHDAAEVDLIRRRSPMQVLPANGASEAFDLGTFSDRENLAQALVLRLLTPRGSLASLGHTAYGSRLHELIGRRKTKALRNLWRSSPRNPGSKTAPFPWYSSPTLKPHPLLSSRSRSSPALAGNHWACRWRLDYELCSTQL